MALFLHLQNLQLNRRFMRRERIFRDRLNPLDAYDDQEIIARYRLSRQLIMRLYDAVGDELEPSTNRNNAIPGMLQIFIALRYYACGSYQAVIGDSIGVHKSSVCRIVHRVTQKLCNIKRQHIQFPHTVAAQHHTKQGFYELAQFPNVLGAIDGTLINIKAPTRDEHLYVSRKGGHSLNVLAVCDSKLKYTYVVAKYPGSSNDAFVWANCILKDRFRNGEFNESWLIGDSGYEMKDFYI